MKARGHEADSDGGGRGGSQPEIPAPKFRHFARSSQTCTFLKKRLSEKYKSSVREIPDLGYADFQRARATTPPVRNRLRMPTAHHNHERALLRDELVSVHRPRKLRHRRRETSSSRRSARSRLWRAEHWHSGTIPHWRSCRACPLEVGTSEIWNLMHGERTSLKRNFFQRNNFSAICGPERRKNLPHVS